MVVFLSLSLSFASEYENLVAFSLCFCTNVLLYIPQSFGERMMCIIVEPHKWRRAPIKRAQKMHIFEMCNLNWFNSRQIHVGNVGNFFWISMALFNRRKKHTFILYHDWSTVKPLNCAKKTAFSNEILFIFRKKKLRFYDFDNNSLKSVFKRFALLRSVAVIRVLLSEWLGFNFLHSFNAKSTLNNLWKMKILGQLMEI